MKIAIVIGHDPKESGVYSETLKQSEYPYNSIVASHITCVDVYERSGTGTYKQQMKALADKLNPKGYDLVCELHFNAANKKAQGVEVVAWKGNDETEKWGKAFCKIIEDAYDIRNRGVKYTSKGGRGYWFSYYNTTNTLILEPFFGDVSDCDKFSDHKKYACNINVWLKEISN